MFGFVYWQTMAYMTGNVDQLNNGLSPLGWRQALC
jgi:hypothetical protein